MKKAFWILAALFTIYLFSSCEDNSIDPRLNGTYSIVNQLYSSEITFKGKTFIKKDEFDDGEKFNFKYKMRQVFYEEDGGVFFCIHDFWPDREFEFEQNREQWGYIVDKNNLFVTKLAMNNGKSYETKYHYVKK